MFVLQLAVTNFLLRKTCKKETAGRHEIFFETLTSDFIALLDEKMPKVISNDR